MTHKLALARLHFAKKEFEEAIELVQKLAHKNIQFSIDIRTLIVRARYEQKATLIQQNSYCDALELYIRRAKNIAEPLRKSVLNFLKILRLLINDKPKKQILNTINTLDAQKEPIMYVAWLKVKIDELHN